MAFSHAEAEMHTGRSASQGEADATLSHPVFDAPPQTATPVDDVQPERPSRPSRRNTRRRRR